jgi:hypothetical protein
MACLADRADGTNSFAIHPCAITVGLEGYCARHRTQPLLLVCDVFVLLNSKERIRKQSVIFVAAITDGNQD